MMPLVHQTLRGKLDLEFAIQRGKTRLMHSYQAPPLRASRVLYMNDDDIATVYLIDTSGGMASGDQNEISVKVSPSSSVHLITQSSTKIYPARLSGDITKQSIHLQVEENGSLFWHPETTIPFSNARFKQEIKVSLKPTSTFYFADILSPGRERHQEKFLYEFVDSSISILYAGKQIAYDRQRLYPLTFSQNQIGLLDEFSYYGSAWYFAPDSDFTTNSIQKALQTNPDIRFAVTELDPVGIHARWLSNDLCLLKESMTEFYQLICK